MTSTYICKYAQEICWNSREEKICRVAEVIANDNYKNCRK